MLPFSAVATLAGNQEHAIELQISMACSSNTLQATERRLTAIDIGTA